MLRYAITNSIRPLEAIRHWLSEGIELVQIREKHLSPLELAALTREVMALPNPWGSKIFVNDRADIAIACGAHGVHLRDSSIDAQRLRRILPRGFFVAVSCHDMEGLERGDSADFIVVAPVFQPLSKVEGRTPLGVDGLKRFAASTEVPVLALGGVTLENAASCVEAGAAGIAGISIFAR